MAPEAVPPHSILPLFSPSIGFGASFDHYTYEQGTEGDDTQIAIGTSAKGFFLQEGLGGNDTQYESGGGAADFEIQQGGTGDDRVFQEGGVGNDTITYEVLSGEDVVFIEGGGGSDDLTVTNPYNQNFTIVNPAGTVLYQSGTGGTLIVMTGVETLNGCPVCSGDPVVLENVIVSGTDCQCNATTSITIGPGVTVKSEAMVTFKAPTVKLQPGFHAESGSTVRIKQE